MRRTVIILIILLAVAARAAGDDAAFLREPVAFTVGDLHVEGDLLLPPTGEALPLVAYVWGGGPTDREGHIARSRVLRLFLAKGCAVYLHDKPGSGGSTGSFTPGRLFAERAAITAAGIRAAAAHPRVDARRVGLYGSSQAAYVMPRLLAEEGLVAFMIAWSCPLQDSVEQSSYLVENLLLCAGYPADEAAGAREAYRRRAVAPDYAAYRAAAAHLEALPEVRDDLGWAGIVAEEHWAPAGADAERFYDPGGAFGPLDLPVLAIYGENDRNIDPVQGAARFRELLGPAPGPLQEIRVLPGADHNMMLTPDGCIQHQFQGYGDVPDAILAPDFLAAIGRWLDKLNNKR